MSLTPLPFSKIQAVNFLLSTIGRSPISDILESPNGTRAAAILDETSRQVQAPGWWFNTDVGFHIPRDNSSKMIVADVCLDAQHAGMLLVHDGKLCSCCGDDCDPVQTRAVIFVEWDELPEGARKYILARAARKFWECNQPVKPPAPSPSIEKRAYDEFLRQEKSAAAQTSYDSMLVDKSNSNRGRRPVVSGGAT